MTEDEQKLAQYHRDIEVAERKAFELRGEIEGVRERCKRAIDEIQKGKAEVERQIKAAKEPKWIAAIGNNNRLILNLAILSKIAKSRLREAIDKNKCWFSFDKEGGWATTSSIPDGLTNYDDTKIIFPKTDIV